MKNNFTKLQKYFWAFCLNLLLFGALYAQEKTVTGRVISSDGESLPGVSVSVKGTNLGAVTDVEGKYSIKVPANATTLIFSAVGMNTQEIVIGEQSSIDITMTENIQGLQEIVVTALGVEKEKKALGYATQSIQGTDLIQARETNIVNSLAGKIAGVTVVGNPTGIGGSARIIIRGERSLNINNNQPLFVVDGVPISNLNVGSSGRSNQEADYGNGAGFVNPDDIESMTVLKGGAAAALYGSRANNGVIIIKTKSGKGTKGIGVSVNTTMTFEDVLRLPEYQNVYGQGLNDIFEFKDGNGGGLADGVDESWGPRMDGRLIRQFNSPTSNGFRGGDVGNLNTRIGPVNLSAQLAARGDITATPFVALPDNVRDFFNTGQTFTQNVAVAGSNENGDMRVSYTYLDQKGIVPNTDLKRNTLSFTGGYNLTKKFKVRAVVNYIKNQSGNRPNLSYGTENLMYLFNCWLGRSVDVQAMQDYWMAGREGLNQFGFNYNYHDNPYFNVFENTNSQDMDRVYGNLALTYQFTDWLSLMVRTGTDFTNEFRARKRAYSTQRFALGNYREEKLFFEERNTDFLLSFNKNITENFSLNANLGGNMMRQIYNNSDITAPELAVPGVYNLGNSRVALLSSNFRSEKRINSLYGSAQVGYKNYLFLDLSARNDWSSTLPSNAWSYFYYGANLSAVISDVVNLPEFISFAKVRAGLAQVGNDTQPYQLLSTYNAQTPVKGLPAYAETSVIPNLNLKPEISTNFEAGVDVRLFKNRIGIDFTYYLTRSKNQILGIPLSNTTGYNSRVINAGLIENRGIELMLNVVPIETQSGLRWSVDFNFSRNRSEVKELTDGIKNFVMASRYVSVEARVGERMGDMYGIGFARVQNTNPEGRFYDPTGQFVGQVVYNSAGKPIPTSETILLGNYNPDWMLGINNNLTFKGINFGFLFDIRQGGKIYSHTQTVGREGGQIIETLEGRANGYDLTQPGNGVIGQGVVQNTDGTFSPNATKLSAREWHTSITLGRRLIEGMMYDASFVKLREVRLGYTIPNKFFGRIPVRDMNLSFVARNLFLWTNVPHIDPETASQAGGTIIPGVESVALPSTRSYGVNLSFRF
jgi:TonB-linked SusC/RagA family outer membrane protein